MTNFLESKWKVSFITLVMVLTKFNVIYIKNIYIVHQTNCLIENIKFMFFMKKIDHNLRVVQDKIFQHSSINKIETNLRMHNFLLLFNFIF